MNLYEALRISELEEEVKSSNTRASMYANLLEAVQVFLEEDDAEGALSLLKGTEE